jgi:hypothetical protein
MQGRWFSCSDKKFSYYKEEGGEIIGSVPLDNITSVTVTGLQT